MKAVKLFFRTPVRIGEASLGLEATSEIIHSDTLFNAIANALSELNEDVDEFIESVKNGDIELSSCFPFKGDTYYLPVPQTPRIEKGRYFTLEKFEEVISGECEKIEGERLDFIRKFEIPKVSLDRTSANSNVYYMSAVAFEKGSGLYFLVRGKVKILKIALKYLKDAGIGGKRTWGLGKFDYEFSDFSIKERGEDYVTLSLTYPEKLEAVKYWKPITRSGWVNSVRKPKLLMASEGSVFSEEEQGVMINLDDISRNLSSKVGHKVFVNGKSFLIRAVVS